MAIIMLLTWIYECSNSQCDQALGWMYHDFGIYIKFIPITGYFDTGRDVLLSDVIVPSTLLTSTWTFLLLLSSVITMFLIPIDSVRRFTAWWFRDVEKRPLTALAKVAGTLIVIGAMAIKAVRWIGP